jgi:hypothetical protein
MTTELYFRRRLQRVHNGETYQICVPPTIVHCLLNCRDVDFVIKNDEICLVPVRDIESDEEART